MSKKFALEMVMYTCRERESTRAATLRSLGASDWSSELTLVVDPDSGPPSPRRMARNFRQALGVAAKSSAAFVLMVEDDLIFNRHLEHNLQHWLESFRPRDVGSLYRSNIGRNCGNQAIVARPIAWEALCQVAERTPPDELQPFDGWLREQVGAKLFRIHSPSLVQHHSHQSTIGHPDHRSRNFDPEYRTP